MAKREVLRTLVEDDKSLLLRRVNGHLELVLGNVVLLSAAALETELHFGRLAKDAPAGRVLIGGVIVAVLLGALLLVRLQRKIVGWRMALAILAAFALFSVAH